MRRNPSCFTRAKMFNGFLLRGIKMTGVVCFMDAISVIQFGFNICNIGVVFFENILFIYNKCNMIKIYVDKLTHALLEKLIKREKRKVGLLQT